MRLISLINPEDFTKNLDNINSLVELLNHNFYENILIPNPEQQELLILIYKLLEEEIIPMGGVCPQNFLKDDSYYLTTDGKKVTNKTVFMENQLFADKKGNKWGYVDLKDNTQVDSIYDQVTEFNEFGYAGVKKDGKWGVMNSDGVVILEPTYVISNDNSPVFIGIYYKDGDTLTNNVY